MSNAKRWNWQRSRAALLIASLTIGCGESPAAGTASSIEQPLVPTYKIAEYWDAHWTLASDKLMSVGTAPPERYTSMWPTTLFGANNVYYEKSVPAYNLLAEWYMKIVPATGEVTEVADYDPSQGCYIVAVSGKEIKWGLPTPMAVGQEISNQRNWYWTPCWWMNDCKWGWNWTKLAAHFNSFQLPASASCPAKSFNDVLLIHNIQSSYQNASCQGNQVFTRTDLVLARSFGIIERRYFRQIVQSAWPAWTAWVATGVHRPEWVCENGPCQCRTQYPVW
jgi:hypothetical protein